MPVESHEIGLQVPVSREDYLAYGLTFRSSRPIRFAIPSGRKSVPDIHFELMAGETELPSADVKRPEFGFATAVRGAGWHIWFKGDGRLDFSINATADRVRVEWTKSCIEEVSGLLLGQVLGCLLRLRQVLSLHACTLAMGGYGIALLGNSGAGKSTLAAYFAATGTPVLADDIAALTLADGVYSVQPGFPGLKLWPKTLEACGVDPNSHHRVFSFSDKRMVELHSSAELPGWQFQPDPLPLGGLVLLQTRRPDLALPEINRVDPVAAVPLLMAQRSSGECALGRAVDARELAAIAGLAAAVPVWSIACPDDLHQLPKTTELIRDCVSRQCGRAV